MPRSTIYSPACTADTLSWNFFSKGFVLVLSLSALLATASIAIWGCVELHTTKIPVYPCFLEEGEPIPLQVHSVPVLF